jgi:hypothetical protein
MVVVFGCSENALLAGPGNTGCEGGMVLEETKTSCGIH